jgi:glycosyltransferase involved in cell wall biosynthesis
MNRSPSRLAWASGCSSTLLTLVYPGSCESTMPYVTVLMSVYNGERFLSEAIDSILTQDFRDFEFLIIDNGSTDGSAAIMSSYKDKRIRLISHKENWGIVRSLNDGLALARGSYIARMDCDDVSLPGRLGYQVRFMDANAEIAVCGTFYRAFNDDRELTVRLPQDPEVIRAALLFYTPLAHPTTLMRASFLRKFGLAYSVPDLYFEDFGLWKRCAVHGKLTNLPRVLLRYRLSPSGVSRTPEFLAERDKAFLGFCRKTLDDLGMPYDDRDLTAYHALINLTNLPIGVYNDASAFLERLVSHNLKVNQYPDAILRRLCGEMWFKLCYCGARMGQRTLTRYASGILRYPYVPTLAASLKFIFRAITLRQKLDDE